jgi:large subunit ribosomal protein L3
VNWNVIISDSDKSLKGFICYKAGMCSAYVKDNTPNSMSKGKNIVIPSTILECPPLKIFSVRFYKNGRVAKEILAENLEKELKRKVKIPKQKREKISIDINEEQYDDIRAICYSQVKKTNIKKTPDLSEIGLFGSVEEKKNFVKENLGKEILINNAFNSGQIIDIRGLTKGKGLQGPVKRFGITLKSHKSEKGRRRPGSLGPWHPTRTTRLTAQAGQMGMFSRLNYNNKIIFAGKSEDKKLSNIKNFGNVKTDYLIVAGSVQGPAKRQLLITSPLRKTKKQLKKSYEFLELR